MIKLKRISLLSTLLLLVVIPIHNEEIHETCSNGKLQKVELMLEKNPALLNIKDKNQNTPLHYAASAGKKEIVEFLITKGAILHAKNNFGWIPLHSASYKGHIETSKLLISKGSKVDELDVFGWTPLFRAIQGGHKSMVEFLVKKGANINARDREEKTPLFLAVLNGEKEIVDYLLDKGATRFLNRSDGETLLHVAASKGFVELVKLLIEKGDSINARKRFDLTPLHMAAAFGQKEVVKFLIEYGADINAVSKLAGTPLSQAISAGYQEVVDLLLKNGAVKDNWKFPDLKGDYLGQIKPGLKPKVFASGILLNIRRLHSGISISPDGKEIYWTASGEYGYSEKIWCIKQKKGRWEFPEIVFFTDEATDGGPFITPDGKKLFFHSNRQLKKDGKTKGDSDIWVVEKVDSRWGEPKNLGPVINSKNHEVSASISKKGNLFFQAYYPTKSLGDSDIYWSEFKNGHYSDPENLGPAINSPYGEGGPFIAPDESYILFHSIRPGGFIQGHQLYISFKTKNGCWTKARNLGSVINGSIAILPYVSPDGKFLFYVRSKNGIFEHMWIDAKIIEKLKPKELK